MNALMSYYLDYYVFSIAGNFAQFVFNSGWNSRLNELIGLQLLGAESIWSFPTMQESS
jgi:hypothetical protein